MGVIIEGVIIQPLQKIEDERGAVLHVMKVNFPMLPHFGEIYCSIIRAGVVKAWKQHVRMSQNLAVPVGRILLAIYDERAGSPSFGKVQVIELGFDDYKLVHLPPMLWYGFKGISEKDSLIVNCADMSHDPAEIYRLPEDSSKIPYVW